MLEFTPSIVRWDCRTTFRMCEILKTILSQQLHVKVSVKDQFFLFLRTLDRSIFLSYVFLIHRTVKITNERYCRRFALVSDWDHIRFNQKVVQRKFGALEIYWFSYMLALSTVLKYLIPNCFAPKCFLGCSPHDYVVAFICFVVLFLIL